MAISSDVEGFRNAIEVRSDDRFSTGMSFADDAGDCLGADLWQHQAINGVHGRRHVGAPRGKPSDAFQAEFGDLGFKGFSHVPAPDDEEASVRQLATNAGGGAEKFGLAFSARQMIGADNGKDVMGWRDSPSLSLSEARAGLEAVHVKAAINDINFRMIAVHGRTIMALGIGGGRIGNALAQHFGDKMRDGDESVALA